MASHVIIGAGPVARAVAASLIARGIEPVVITRSGAAIPGTAPRRCDITDPSAGHAAVAGARVIFQCAQPAYHRWPQEFPALQARVVDAAESAGAVLVAAENLYGYGRIAGPITEAQPLDATTRKGAVRAQMWRDLEAAHTAGRVRVVAARASDFFGPGVEASAVGARFFTPLIAGKAAMVVGDPTKLHTYTYVPDFGEAMVRLTEVPAAWGQAWHVPNAPTVSTQAFADLVAGSARGSSASGTARPSNAARLRPMKGWQLAAIGAFVPAIRETKEMVYEFDEDWVVDHSRYVALLGNHATPLEDAVRATVASFDTAAPLRSSAKAAHA